MKEHTPGPWFFERGGDNCGEAELVLGSVRGAMKDGGTSTSGYGGTSTSGDGGTSTSGDGGILQMLWWDGKRYRIATFYVGEDGIEPNTPYRVDENGRPVKVEKPSKEAA